MFVFIMNDLKTKHINFWVDYEVTIFLSHYGLLSNSTQNLYYMSFYNSTQ